MNLLRKMLNLNNIFQVSVIRHSNTKTNGHALIVEEFTVMSGCALCKSRIEEAAKLLGVIYASWSFDSGIIRVMYDANKTTSKKIHKSIAAAGYDTSKYKAPAAAYNALPVCAKYTKK